MKVNGKEIKPFSTSDGYPRLIVVQVPDPHQPGKYLVVPFGHNLNASGMHNVACDAVAATRLNEMATFNQVIEAASAEPEGAAGGDGQ